MKKLGFGTLAVFFFTALAVGELKASPGMHAMNEKKPAAGGTMHQADFKNAMRKLWEDHIEYTRNFIISALAGLEDTNKVAERLLRNQDDIGDAIKPVYGEEAGKKLSGLLRDHILIAADIVTAAKTGEKPKLEEAKARWVANADEIAAFLAGANPRFWAAAEMKAMMREHLDLTAAELTARLERDWARDVAAYDKIHVQILKMADMLADGILRQAAARRG